VVSILHRASGLLMFVLLPFVVWLFDTSISSEISYESFTAASSSASASCPAGRSSWSCWP